MHRLGGRVLSTEQARRFSSEIEGEQVEDSIRIVGHYADVIVIRHHEADGAARAARVPPVPVINAGDGQGGEHPTQALLDLYTIYREQPLDGLRIDITGTEILKEREIGVGTFSYADSRADYIDDCGYIAWQKTGEAQDAFIKTLVPAKTNVYTRISKTICDLQWVQDSQNAQRLGHFFFQRTRMRMADVAFKSKGTCLDLNPGDVITISDASVTGHRPYGGGTILKWNYRH